MNNPFSGLFLQFEVNKRSKVTINVIETNDIRFRGEISNLSELGFASAFMVGLIMIKSMLCSFSINY